MKKMLQWPLELASFKSAGYEPAELYSAMRWQQRVSPAALMPVTVFASCPAQGCKDRSAKGATGTRCGADPAHTEANDCRAAQTDASGDAEEGDFRVGGVYGFAVT